MKKLLLIFYTGITSTLLSVVFFMITNGVHFVHSNQRLLATISMISLLSVGLSLLFVDMLEENGEEDE